MRVSEKKKAPGFPCMGRSTAEILGLTFWKCGCIRIQKIIMIYSQRFNSEVTIVLVSRARPSTRGGAFFTFADVSRKQRKSSFSIFEALFLELCPSS